MGGLVAWSDMHAGAIRRDQANLSEDIRLGLIAKSDRVRTEAACQVSQSGGLSVIVYIQG